MINSFKGKTILLGVSGGIAAYKAADLASKLVKLGCKVHTILTENGAEFVTPLTFETLTKRECITSSFERKGAFDVKHVELAKAADLVVIAPATANILAKMAHGIADDMLSTTALACRCKKIVFPAMNTAMYENEATIANLETLKSRGIKVAQPAEGMLACGDVGKGRLPDLDTMIEQIGSVLKKKEDLKGKNVLITAGATQEALDPVRFITNHSSGKMGYALANAAKARGANVTLVSGKADIDPPRETKFIKALSAQEMYDAVLQRADSQDICILSAAVSDYRPMKVAEHKIKKQNEKMTIELERTKDILFSLGHKERRKYFLCGFCMETKDLLENAKIKLEKKNADMIVANSLNEEGAGFKSDTNHVFLVSENEVCDVPLMSKRELSDVIFDRVLKEI